MTEKLLDLHNERVKPEDHFYNLGDVTMIRGGALQQQQLCDMVRKFNGHKRLIMGNHDHFPVEAYVRAGFEKVMAMQMFDNIRFTHIPIHPQSMGSAIANVHGHIHDTPSPPPVVSKDDKRSVVKPYINISMEMINYKPISLEEVKDLIKIEVEKHGS